MPFALIAAVILGVALFPKTRVRASAEKRVVVVWNVDTFEGGKGSRTSFLRNAATIAEKKNKGVYYLISNYTLEGANAAFAEGIRPDVLSFGIGLSAFAEHSLPLAYEFAGGNTDAGCLAYPWCRGSYYLFSLKDDFTEQGTTAISQGGNNLPEIAAAYAGIRGEKTESTAAYVGFLNGSYRYLLGTQRDVCRFAARGAAVYSKALPEYCDLFQYISILSQEKRRDCDALLETLLSDDVQKKLSQIGMYSVSDAPDSRTLSVFSTDETLQTVSDLARKGESVKNLDKFLKFN